MKIINLIGWIFSTFLIRFNCLAADADTLQIFFPDHSRSYLEAHYSHFDIDSTPFRETIRTHSGDDLNAKYTYGLSESSAVYLKAEYSSISAGIDKKLVSQTNTIYIGATAAYHRDNSDTYSGWNAEYRTTREAPSSPGLALRAAINKSFSSFKIGALTEIKYREAEVKTVYQGPALGVSGSTSTDGGLYASVYLEYNSSYRPNIAYVIAPSYSYLNSNFKRADAYSAFTCEVRGFTGSVQLFMNETDTVAVIPSIGHFASSNKDCGSSDFSTTQVSMNIRIQL